MNRTFTACMAGSVLTLIALGAVSPMALGQHVNISKSAIRQAEETRALLERLAKQEEAKLLQDVDNARAKFQDDYVRDRASYSFECRRWNDFLTIWVNRTRGSVSEFASDNPGSWIVYKEESAYTTSLNLHNVATIALTPGHPPDEDGKVTYYYESNGPECATVSGGPPVPKSCPWTVYAQAPIVPEHHHIFRMEIPPHQGPGFVGTRAAWANDRYDIKLVTGHYPRPAEDDVIEFSGIGVSLYVPANRGQGILDKILSAKDTAPAVK